MGVSNASIHHRLMLESSSASDILRLAVAMSDGRESGVANMLRVMVGAATTKKRAVILIAPHLSIIFICYYLHAVVSRTAVFVIAIVSLRSDVS